MAAMLTPRGHCLWPLLLLVLGQQAVFFQGAGPVLCSGLGVLRTTRGHGGFIERAADEDESGSGVGSKSTTPTKDDSESAADAAEDVAPGQGMRRETPALVPDDGASTFKILQLADLHLGEDLDGTWGPAQDSKTLDAVRFVLDKERPNLVVFSGDQITGEGLPRQEDREKILARLVEPLEARGIPWATVFGNHDGCSKPGCTGDAAPKLSFAAGAPEPPIIQLPVRSEAPKNRSTEDEKLDLKPKADETDPVHAAEKKLGDTLADHMGDIFRHWMEVKETENATKLAKEGQKDKKAAGKAGKDKAEAKLKEEEEKQKEARSAKEAKQKGAEESGLKAEVEKDKASKKKTRDIKASEETAKANKTTTKEAAGKNAEGDKANKTRESEASPKTKAKTAKEEEDASDGAVSDGKQVAQEEEPASFKVQPLPLGRPFLSRILSSNISGPQPIDLRARRGAAATPLPSGSPQGFGLLAHQDDDSEQRSSNKAVQRQEEYMAHELQHKLSRTAADGFFRSEKGGMGNYRLKLYASKEDVASDRPSFLLWFVDTGGGGLPDSIQSDQLAWLTKESEALEAKYGPLPGALYAHIPMPEYSHTDPADPKSSVCAGVSDDDVTSLAAGPRLFPLLSQMHVGWVFAGHDHGNDWCCQLGKQAKLEPAASFLASSERVGATRTPPEDIHLCYGRHSGYGGYSTPQMHLRGARVLEVDPAIARKFLLGQSSWSGVKSWVRLEDGTVGKAWSEQGALRSSLV